MKNKQIEALEKLIALKDETIKELERQVQLLKNQPPITVPQLPIQPYAPPIYPQSPNYPWWQPYIITSGTGDSIKVAADILPPGSVQSSTNNTTLPEGLSYTA